MVNSLTSRGHLGKLEPAANITNVLFFSARKLKSDLDLLTAHQFDPNVTPFVRKQAAANLVKIVGGMAAILTTAKILNPDSVDFDPRSSRFGTIKIGQTSIDISGGMAGLIRLAARIVPTVHDGELGLWSENASGKWTDLTAGKFGQQTGMDVVEGYFEGKLSPLLGVFRDFLKGKNFQGQKPTIAGTAEQLVTPMGAQTAEQLQNEPNSGAAVASWLLDFFGFSANPPNAGDFSPQVQRMMASPGWKRMTPEHQAKVLAEIRGRQRKAAAAQPTP